MIINSPPEDPWAATSDQLEYIAWSIVEDPTTRDVTKLKCLSIANKFPEKNFLQYKIPFCKSFGYVMGLTQPQTVIRVKELKIVWSANRPSYNQILQQANILGKRLIQPLNNKYTFLEGIEGNPKTIKFKNLEQNNHNKTKQNKNLNTKPKAAEINRSYSQSSVTQSKNINKNYTNVAKSNTLSSMNLQEIKPKNRSFFTEKFLNLKILRTYLLKEKPKEEHCTIATLSYRKKEDDLFVPLQIPENASFASLQSLITRYDKVQPSKPSITLPQEVGHRQRSYLVDVSEKPKNIRKIRISRREKSSLKISTSLSTSVLPITPKLSHGNFRELKNEKNVKNPITKTNLKTERPKSSFESYREKIPLQQSPLALYSENVTRPKSCIITPLETSTTQQPQKLHQEVKSTRERLYQANSNSKNIPPLTAFRIKENNNKLGLSSVKSYSEDNKPRSSSSFPRNRHMSLERLFTASKEKNKNNKRCSNTLDTKEDISKSLLSLTSQFRSPSFPKIKNRIFSKRNKSSSDLDDELLKNIKEEPEVVMNDPKTSNARKNFIKKKWKI